MNKLIFIAMVSLGVVACTKENHANRSNGSNGSEIRPLIGNVEYEIMDVYPKENMLPFTQNSLNIYEVPNHQTWRELTNNVEDPFPEYGVDFNTHRVLVIYNDHCTIESMIGTETNIVVTAKTYNRNHGEIGPTDAPFPGCTIKIPRTNQSVTLNILPDVHEDAPNYDDE